jgi:glycerol-1-phosphate dehydrogenase [NAD(P)+]
VKRESSFLQVIESAPETKCLELGSGALDRTPAVFSRFFPKHRALIIADPRTFAVAGHAVLAGLRHVTRDLDSLVFTDPGFYADHSVVCAIEAKLRERSDAIPVAVGSGTINDVTKLAAHRTGRRYMAVATAASMDGYTAFGASITHQGSKQTFGCAAPVAVVADMEILQAAPAELTAAGYADLLAKVTAGADWLLADALAVEAVQAQAWEIVQGNLRSALKDPAGVKRRDSIAIRHLTEGLILSGFAMQVAGSSRPASGAEHQFSHLWDMQHHTHAGAVPLHGFKVAIGTVAVAALYEYLLEQPLETLDVNACCEHWPPCATVERTVRDLFGNSDLAVVALQETRAKYVDAAGLREQLLRLRRVWPELRTRLRKQLVPLSELKKMLRAAGAPSEPEQISLSPERLRDSFRLAYFIRRRFTVLDLAVRTGLLDKALFSLVP